MSPNDPSSFARPTPIVYARGDGIGPEIMDATLAVLQAAGAELDLHEIQIGQKVYERGITAGIEPESWELLRKTGVFLKARSRRRSARATRASTSRRASRSASTPTCVRAAVFTRSRARCTRAWTS
jgi:isocitrate/isopropylmalate dehydrogenase